MKRRALISVYDKTNIVSFAKALIKHDFEIISTGGTYSVLKEAGIKVIPVMQVTDSKEILNGRVKTLHPAIHGGILAVRNDDHHMAQLNEESIHPIDLVCVNLYPFSETVNKESTSFNEAIEQIDIGGPTLLRAAAKNHKYVTVITDTNDYQSVITELNQCGETTPDTRRRLATTVFFHTADYDSKIASYLNQEEFPETITLSYKRKQILRYGENPHQKAALYSDSHINNTLILRTKQLHGKDLSYNNIKDANTASDIINEYSAPTVVALKHMNPCGIGSAKTIYDAWIKAYDGDQISIFGGIIATNQVIDHQTAIEMGKLFLELIIAPGFTEEALQLLKKRKNTRLLELIDERKDEQCFNITTVTDGLLMQEQDQKKVNLNQLEIPTKKKPCNEEFEQLLFAWKAVKHVKSNAIVIAKDSQTIGIGAGQMNRVGAAEIALRQAGDKCRGAVLASDGFFPMPDTVELAVKYGISSIIQPGGSIRDQDSIDACNKHGISMVLTKTRHFKH
ncbi:bifunctional phosphoribosylaminoimidazolecarboxamide formyltransferase/IMP cyclohydrolase [Haloplasma contractile]|uniref:Bifunctional purine biosynthesis protein PurH n=1 Tax=Haloplasma contractile SSD-17B TaxID=1033810 RepID=U2DU20_9MOLU|nr:bifunctional phosphoribosylaminoimidazolecarboxamide formyltransferase/IMP cyclohydrolase [Haloplasma contractile]ERJ11942.1 Bifunctional purine biosynthesis protein PurH [Haloplasma contractile SSD-17B]